MHVDRRGLLVAGIGVGGFGLVNAAAASTDSRQRRYAATADTEPPTSPVPNTASAHDLGLVPDSIDDQTARLQAAIDEAHGQRRPLILPPGRYRAQGLQLRPGSALIGTAGMTTLALARPGPLVSAKDVHDITVRDMRFDGGMLEIPAASNALLSCEGCERIDISRVAMSASAGRGIALERCGGRVALNTLTSIKDAAIFANDSTGLDIIDNRIEDCGNAGIQVWRSVQGEDGTIVARNRIARIAATSGGSGQYGNGINIFRAANVLVDANRITDCAYSAVRGNAASNIQILANNCQRIGEVALYAEFGFEGAIIANNIVDGAATGISVTNFNVGGRLAVVQANLIRNLKRREHEPVDKRGEGIAVEADANVVGNTIENAPTAGIVLGWGRYMRNCVASANVIRSASVGILVTSDGDAGACLVTGNMISDTRDGAIRAMHEGVAFGPDLARIPPTTGRVTIQANMAV